VIMARYVLRLTRLYFESVDRGTVTLARLITWQENFSCTDVLQ